MENSKIIKVFLASPSDVKEEREMIFSLKNDLDHLIGKPNGMRFEFVNWERNSYPGIGIDAQDVINHNIKNDYDVFIGIFWMRFGTPTNRAESGTKEEFDIAYKRYKENNLTPHIMLYFKTDSPGNLYEFDYSQFEKVKKFREEAISMGVLYWEFCKIDELRNLLLIHLSSLIRDKFSSTFLNQHSSIDTSESKSLSNYEILAKKIDERNDDLTKVGILEIFDILTDSTEKTTQILNKITMIISNIGDKFHSSTLQIKRVTHIKDNRLRNKQSTAIINTISSDMDAYSSDMHQLLPDFKNNFNMSIELYAKLLLLKSTNQQNDDISIFEEMSHQILESIDFTLVEISRFLETFSNITIMTSKFGKSKRNAELATNELFKEFIAAKNALDQLNETSERY